MESESKMKNRQWLLVGALSFLPLAACEKGSMEKAGEKADEALEEAGDKIEDAGDKVEDTLDKD